MAGVRSTVKTTLINPPQIFTKSQIGAGVTPPLGVAYLAAYLLAHDRPVQVIDALGEDPRQLTPFRKNSYLRGLTLEQIVDKIDPDSRLVGISNLFSFAYPAVEELCEMIHRRYPHKGIILGGPHPSAYYKEILCQHPEVDYVAIGEEGEETLLKLVMHLEGEAELDILSGIALRGEAGEPLVLKSTKRFEKLEQDSMPYPARHLLPMENYIKAQEGHGPSTGRWTSILSSRGCPYGCTFCSSRRTKWIGRTARDVVDEMEHCQRTWGIEEFHFEDDNMTINTERLLSICDEIIQRKLRVRWQTPNGIRASRTTEAMLRRMKDSGCMHITLAPESGSPRVLKEIVQKGNDFSLEQLKACGEQGHKIGLKVAAYFILGMPGETKEDIEMTIRYSRELATVGVDEVAFGLFIPLPGTPLWDAVADMRTNFDFLDLLSIGDLSRAVSWSKHVSGDELHTLRRKAYLTFHLTRLFYHPIAFLRTLLNVVRNVEETKTERTLRQYLQRFSIKRKKYSEGDPQPLPADQDLNAYPYDGVATIKVILQNEAHYSYRHSLLKGIRLVKQDILSSRLFRPTKNPDHEL